MATVYITKELITRVKTKINSMRRSERNSDLPNIDKTIPLDASVLFNTGCWGAEHVHLLNVIPDTWLIPVTESSVKVVGKTDDGRELTAFLRFSGMQRARQRPTPEYWNKSDSKFTLSQLRELPPEMLGRSELLQRWDECLVELVINDRWDKIEKDILEFLDKCKSLNEAVKLFPGVRMYLLDEDIERLDRKIERTAQRKQIVNEVDTEGLTAAAIAAKLAEAS